MTVPNILERRGRLTVGWAFPLSRYFEYRSLGHFLPEPPLARHARRPMAADAERAPPWWAGASARPVIALHRIERPAPTYLSGRCEREQRSGGAGVVVGTDASTDEAALATSRKTAAHSKAPVGDLPTGNDAYLGMIASGSCGNATTSRALFIRGDDRAIEADSRDASPVQFGGSGKGPSGLPGGGGRWWSSSPSRLAAEAQRAGARPLERDVAIAIELLAAFVRYFVTITPPLPTSETEAARALGQQRFQQVIAGIGRRLNSDDHLIARLLNQLERTSTRRPPAEGVKASSKNRDDGGAEVGATRGFPADPRPTRDSRTILEPTVSARRT